MIHTLQDRKSARPADAREPAEVQSSRTYCCLEPRSPHPQAVRLPPNTTEGADRRSPPNGELLLQNHPSKGPPLESKYPPNWHLTASPHSSRRRARPQTLLHPSRGCPRRQAIFDVAV